MEHNRPEGLAPGYYCCICGQSANVYGSGHGPGLCEPNPVLVKQLDELNKVKDKNNG